MNMLTIEDVIIKTLKDVANREYNPDHTFIPELSELFYNILGGRYNVNATIFDSYDVKEHEIFVINLMDMNLVQRTRNYLLRVNYKNELLIYQFSMKRTAISTKRYNYKKRTLEQILDICNIYKSLSSDKRTEKILFEIL